MSNVVVVVQLFVENLVVDVVIVFFGIDVEYVVDVFVEYIGDNLNVVMCFVLVMVFMVLFVCIGLDKMSIIVEFLID